MRLLALSGSVRQLSTNTALLRRLAELAPEAVTVDVFEGIGALPIFSPDREGDLTPTSVLAFAALVEKADGLIFSSPEYAHGIPGGLKNALDWLVSRSEIPEKPGMLLHASHRGDVALAALREVLTTIKVALVDEAFATVPLIGKTPDEVAALLHHPEIEGMLRDKLSVFVSALPGEQSACDE